MNSFIRLFSQRISANIRCYAKLHYRASSSVKTLKLDVNPVLGNEKITQLVQKMIIPLNGTPPKPSILDKPCVNIIGKIDSSLPRKVDIEPKKEILDPGNILEKKAHRMLIIKRKKMNKHKFKKKQKKYYHQNMRIQRERFAKKEATFRREIYGLLQEADKFDAEQYVAKKLELYRRKVITNRINGVRMPPDVVKDYLEKKQQAREKRMEMIERKKQRLALSALVNLDTK